MDRELSPSGGAVVHLVDGVAPNKVVAPTSVTELQELLRDASALGVVVCGNGTKLDFGAPPTRYDLQLDLTRLPTEIRHSPGDLVVRVSANTSMHQLASTVNESGQRLSIDEVVPNTTVGGLVATALCGPLRYRYGAVRDLLIGVSYIRADGTAGKAGGIVVKNVAGYDLSKLFCGSFGTLAVLTECIFRLHPLPERRRILSALLPLNDAVRAAQRIASGTQDVAAVELDVHPDGMAELGISIEGSASGTDHRASAVANSVGHHFEEQDGVPPWWGVLPGPVVVKIAFAPAQAAPVLETLRRLLGERVSIRGSIGLGLLNLGLPLETTSDELSATLASLRPALLPHDGTAMVLRADGAQKAGVDLFGPVPGLDLMERIKMQFDPHQMLGPGRFVGGW